MNLILKQKAFKKLQEFANDHNTDLMVPNSIDDVDFYVLSTPSAYTPWVPAFSNRRNSRTFYLDDVLTVAEVRAINA